MSLYLVVRGINKTQVPEFYRLVTSVEYADRLRLEAESQDNKLFVPWQVVCLDATVVTTECARCGHLDAPDVAPDVEKVLSPTVPTQLTPLEEARLSLATVVQTQNAQLEVENAQLQTRIRDLELRLQHVIRP